MTSAPMSPSSRPVNGPASSCPSSTTRTPASGPGPSVAPRRQLRLRTRSCVLLEDVRLLGLELRNQEVARLEHVLCHHELGPLGVARGKAVVIWRW